MCSGCLNPVRTQGTKACKPIRGLDHSQERRAEACLGGQISQRTGANIDSVRESLSVDSALVRLVKTLRKNIGKVFASNPRPLFGMPDGRKYRRCFQNKFVTGKSLNRSSPSVSNVDAFNPRSRGRSIGRDLVHSSLHFGPEKHEDFHRLHG